MPDPPSAVDRSAILRSTRQVVIKLGTRVVCEDCGRLNPGRVGLLADQISQLLDGGLQVVLVSSGAVGAGMSQLGLTERPQDLAKLQAVAAVGQARLINEYERHLSERNRHAAQVLLTSDDLDDRTRYLNVRNTLLELLEIGAVPIINENDTVAVEELMTTFGDNDHLAAQVSNLWRSTLLIILTDVDGLFDGDPKLAASQVIPTVTRIDKAIQHVCDESGQLSRGGMKSKLEAARECTVSGKHVILANGHRANVLTDIIAGQEIGTLFLGHGKAVSPLKRWIGFSAKPKGVLTLDAGACRALRQDGRSLLPIGVQQVAGSFQKGDVVSLVDKDGQELARGLSNYAASEVRTIRGHRSEKIGELLGHCPYDELIHRDNLMLVSS
jgi:glutamate 5-kinase